MDDWRWMSAAQLGEGIGAGQIDPVALAETFLAAIAEHPYGDRIYARVTADRALTEATAARERARAGLRRGPLDGVPISWKDLFDTAGTATEAGTQLMAGRVPDTDAHVLQLATAAGLVCLGKTHLSEIAFSGLGLNPMTATSPNVHDAENVAGGSSSGAATSVAFGLAAAAIGTDTGGSVRIPAAWNDVVGFKTTHGLLSTEGVVPLCMTFDTVGPLARTVEDCALLVAAMGGPAAPDLAGASVAGLRLAILDTVAMDELRAAPRAAFESAVARLKDAGAEVTHLSFPDMATAFSYAGTVYPADSYAWWRERVEAAPHKMFPQILERIRAGRDVKAVDYIAQWNDLRRIRAAWRKATAAFDAIIMPTAPITPPNAKRLMTDDAYYKSENLLALRNTRVANLMGTCAVSLPTGHPGCGFMLNAQAGDEAKLLRMAAAAERALA